MSSGIATQFVCIVPELPDLRKSHLNLKPISVIAHFIASSNNWIYNLATKRHFFDKPTFSDLQNWLCCLKSHLLQNNIKVVHLRHIECGLDKMQWTIVLMKLVTISESTDIFVENFLLRDTNSNSSEKMLLAEESSWDEETQRHVQEMSKVRKLGLRNMLKCPPTNDRNNRDTPH